MILPFILALEICFAGRPQYNNYDASPYSTGERVESKDAMNSCKEHNRRLCTSLDLASLIAQQRFSCEHSWFYKRDIKHIVAGIVLTEHNDCFIQKPGIFKMLPLIDRDTSLLPLGNIHRNIFYCKEFIDKTKHCTGTGQDYYGNIDVTENGNKCQIWVKTKPHTSEWQLGFNDWNFCRNPEGYRARPWCYVDRPDVEWEYCAITCENYGDFDKCEFTMYYGKDFTGKSCKASVGAGEFNYYNYDNWPCRGFTDDILAFKLEGSHCFVRVKHDWGLSSKTQYFSPNTRYPYFNFKIKDFSLHDSSPQVIFRIFDQNDLENLRKNMGYNICTPDGVDKAEYFENQVEGSQIGLVELKGVRMYYSFGHGHDKNSKKKPSMCCEDENVRVTDNVFTKENSETECEKQYRTESFDVRGKEVIYKKQGRMCTSMDIITHFINYDKTSPDCFVRHSEIKGDIVRITNGNIQKIVTGETAKICCCDKDCFPLNYLCGKNEDCCTRNCTNGLCFDDSIKPYDKPPVKDIEAKLPTWLKVVIVIAFLFTLSWCLRCCFPERRALGNMVRLHEE